MFELLGFAGIVISVLAYLPQVVHLAREHCSAGVSGRAWSMWLASSVMVGALALHRHDPVFILLQVSTLLSASVIVVLVHRYRGMICETHALAAREAATTSTRRRTSSSDRLRARQLAKHGASGRQRPVDVVARCLRRLGEQVDRHTVDRQRLEDEPLIGRQGPELVAHKLRQRRSTAPARGAKPAFLSLTAVSRMANFAAQVANRLLPP